jgi:hypothetical protein
MRTHRRGLFAKNKKFNLKSENAIQDADTISMNARRGIIAGYRCSSIIKEVCGVKALKNGAQCE